jgi:hypothetical protein
MFMKSKNVKTSKVVVSVATALTGLIMVLFQNCSRVNSIEVSDLAGGSLISRDLAAPNETDNLVSVQIVQDDGTIVNVDPSGNETVMPPVVSDNGQSQTSGSAGNSQDQTVVKDPVATTEPVREHDEDKEHGDRRHDDKDHEDRDHDDKHHGYVNNDDDDSDLVVCEPYKVNTNLAASYEKMKCKKNNDDDHGRRIRCMDLIRENGVTVIDIAKLNDVSVLKSIKGSTIIYSSVPGLDFVKSIVIEHAVGKTILCGIKVARLDVKKGNLELREGSNVKSCGTIKGKIKKDDESSIDGASTEE